MAFIFQEAATTVLPNLMQTSLYVKFDQMNQLTQKVKDTLADKEHYVSPDQLKEIMSLIRLNGSPVAKKAVDMFEKGKMRIIFNRDTSVIPVVLPYVVIGDKSGNVIPYIFADRVVTNINSSAEYPNLMAAMESAFLAAALKKNPNKFVMNRQLMQYMCALYNSLWDVPLEQKLYVKGENLTKVKMYVTAYFYRMIDGARFDGNAVPYGKIIGDDIPKAMATQIGMEVAQLPNLSIANLINLIKQINPVRYQNLDATFISYFSSSCGNSLIFALENLQYVFLEMSSANYKTKLTAYSLNRLITKIAKQCIQLLNGMDITY